MNNKRKPGRTSSHHDAVALPYPTMTQCSARHTMRRINAGSAVENGVGEGVESARRSGRGSLSDSFFSTHVTPYYCVRLHLERTASSL